MKRSVAYAVQQVNIRSDSLHPHNRKCNGQYGTDSIGTDYNNIYIVALVITVRDRYCLHNSSVHSVSELIVTIQMNAESLSTHYSM